MESPFLYVTGFLVPAVKLITFAYVSSICSVLKTCNEIVTVDIWIYCPKLESQYILQRDGNEICNYHSIPKIDLISRYGNFVKTHHFHKTLTPGNWVKFRYFVYMTNNSERFMLEFLQTIFLDFYIFKSLVSSSVS